MVNNWKVILATLVIFGAGVMTGGLLVNHVQNGRLRPPPFPGMETGPRSRLFPPGEVRSGPLREANLGVPSSQRLGEGLLSRMDQEMNLTPGQRERVRDIITAGQERMRLANEKLRPILQKEMQETRRQIREVLNPEQIERFEELMKVRPPRRPEEPLSPERRFRESQRPLPPRDGPLPDAGVPPPKP